MDYQWFCGPSNPAQAFTADQERTVNFYFEKSVYGSTTRAALYPTPGINEINVLPVGVSGGGRAHLFDDGREFAVIGNSFVEYDEAGRETRHGTVLDDGLPATISSNGDGGGQLFICSGNNGYLFQKDTNILGIIGPLVNKARMGDFVDGYFLALDTGSSTLYISGLLDGFTWNTGTDFAQRSKYPDKWIAMKVLNSQIYLLGTKTSEVWYNVGATFPFAPNPSGYIQYGCAATFSVTVVDQVLMWLGSSQFGNRFVLRVSGYSPEIVSTPAVQTVLSAFEVIDDAQGDAYSDLGHVFYCLNFPDAESTWCLDLTTALWHERGSWFPERNEYTVWLPRWHAMAFGQHRILHAEHPFLLELSSESTTDALPGSHRGDPIRRLRRAPAITNEHERVYYESFELLMDTGIARNLPPAGRDPQIFMRQSKDGGKSWTSERWASGGQTGEYSTRVVWDRCGVGRRMVFEVVQSDPVPWRIIGAVLNTQAAFSTRTAGAA